MTLKTLKTLDLSTKVVDLPGGQMAVRGLSISEIMKLAVAFRPTLATIFEEMAKAAASSNGEPSVTIDQAMAITTNIFQEAPEFVASVIVLGCYYELDDQEALNAARSLDIGSQIALVNAIAELTFVASGGPGNVVRLLMSAIAGTSSQIGSQKT